MWEGSGRADSASFSKNWVVALVLSQHPSIRDVAEGYDGILFLLEDEVFLRFDAAAFL